MACELGANSLIPYFLGVLAVAVSLGMVLAAIQFYHHQLWRRPPVHAPKMTGSAELSFRITRA